MGWRQPWQSLRRACGEWERSFGRRLAARLRFRELTALRLFFGAGAALLVVALTGTFRAYGLVGPRSALSLVLLALIPGLLSLLIYYRGLRGTPASAATLGELAFPLTALVIGYGALNASLTVSQWLGVALLSGTITAMGLLRSRGVPTGVEVRDLHDAAARTTA